jgi:hypothetical protein
MGHGPSDADGLFNQQKMMSMSIFPRFFFVLARGVAKHRSYVVV